MSNCKTNHKVEYKKKKVVIKIILSRYYNLLRCHWPTKYVMMIVGHSFCDRVYTDKCLTWIVLILYKYQYVIRKNIGFLLTSYTYLSVAGIQIHYSGYTVLPIDTVRCEHTTQIWCENSYVLYIRDTAAVDGLFTQSVNVCPSRRTVFYQFKQKLSANRVKTFGNAYNKLRLVKLKYHYIIYIQWRMLLFRKKKYN